MDTLQKPPVAMRIYSQIARRVPLLSGLTPLAFNRLTNRSFGASNYVALATTHGGLNMAVAVNDYHGRILYLFGTNDPKVQALASALLSPGDTFLDIGANYSTIGLYASLKVGAAGHVHLFEPQPALADRVQAAIDAGGVSNVSMHRVALMDKDASMTMKVPPSHSGMATLVEHSDQSTWETLTVEVRDIARYVGPLVGAARFGVKLDVEGAEPKLVPWIVAQQGLKFLIFEAAHHHEMLFDQVRSAGLAVFGLRRNLFRPQVQRVNSVSALRHFHDLVAVRVATAPSIVSMKRLGALIESP